MSKNLYIQTKEIVDHILVFGNMFNDDDIVVAAACTVIILNSRKKSQKNFGLYIYACFINYYLI